MIKVPLKLANCRINIFSNLTFPFFVNSWNREGKIGQNFRNTTNSSSRILSKILGMGVLFSLTDGIPPLRRV